MGREQAMATCPYCAQARARLQQRRLPSGITLDAGIAPQVMKFIKGGDPRPMLKKNLLSHIRSVVVL
jgi:hypothetical protein